MDARLAGAIDPTRSVLTNEAGHLEPRAHGIGQETVLQSLAKDPDGERLAGSHQTAPSESSKFKVDILSKLCYYIHEIECKNVERSIVDGEGT